MRNFNLVAWNQTRLPRRQSIPHRSFAHLAEPLYQRALAIRENALDLRFSTDIPALKELEDWFDAQRGNSGDSETGSFL